MGEEFFQFLIFLFIAVVWALEALARARKKKQKEEEMAEEERGGSLHRREERAPSPWEQEPEAFESAGWEEDEEEEDDAEVTAEGLIPADLWEEITGLKRPAPSEAPRTPAPAPRSPTPSRPSPPSVESRPGPVTRPAPPPVPAPSPSGSRWDHERTVKVRPTDFPERLRPTELADEAERIREEGRRALAAEAAEAAETEVQVEVRPRPYGIPGRRKLRTGGTAAGRLLRESLRGDTQALQKAVLYREVLGPPLGTRGTGGWEDPS